MDASDGGAANTLLVWSGAYGSAITNLAFDNFTAPPGTRCATQKVGACWIIDCSGTGSTPTAIGGGQVELYGTGDAGTTVLLSSSPNANGYYDFASQSSQLWVPGEAIGLRAAGGALPAFDLPFTAPSPVTVTSPSADAGSISITRSAGLTVTWTGATGTVIVAVSQTVNASATDLTGSIRFVCELPGAGGTASIPASVTGVLSTTAISTSLNVGGAMTADTTVAGHPLHAYVLNVQKSWTATVQ